VFPIDGPVSPDGAAPSASPFPTDGTRGGRGGGRGDWEAGAGGGMGGGMGLGDQTVTISGGTVTIDAGGDGFDSNGSAKITGGTIVIHGPDRSGNGALDVQGDFEITGGTIVAVGASGMLDVPDSGGAQAWVMVVFEGDAPGAGETLSLAAPDGTVMASIELIKSAQSFFVSVPEVDAQATYTVRDSSGAQLAEAAADTAPPGTWAMR
jgi:hypothetical protein